MLSFTGKYSAPIGVGGVGGSGTRLIAKCLQQAGYFIGSDLNRADDNLWCTLLFKRIDILESSESEFDELFEIFIKGMTGCGKITKAQKDLIHKLASSDRDQHPSAWLGERAASLMSSNKEIAPDSRWGWKEPNTHIILDRLAKRMPSMKYIHVMRNGLHMAHSANQNQLKFWGGKFLGANYEISPYYSLKYWCIMHRRILEIGNSMGKNFYLLNYDDFVLQKEKNIQELVQFLELELPQAQIEKLYELINIPASIHKPKPINIDMFDDADLAFVKQMGFVANIN